MRVLALFLISVALLFAGSVEREIQKKRQELRKTNREIRGLNLKLGKLATNITVLKRDLKKLDRRLAELQKEVTRLQEEHREKLEEYRKVKDSVKELNRRSAKLKRKLIKAISKSFSKSLLLASLGEQGEEDLLKEEILKALQRREDRQLEKISREYEQVQEDLAMKERLLARLKGQIDDLIEKEKSLQELKGVKKKKLQQLASQKRRYKEELKRLHKQRTALYATLRELRIAKEERVASRASSKVPVRGGSWGYKKDRTVRYRGKKTIPPLKRFTITKRYGVYVDPIYKIKIPNENIEMKPLESNAKVRNVLNGRIILAKQTPHLKNVVIVKHSNNLYTIYANIDKLSKYARKGRRIRRGVVLGRVKNKLIFEVTKNNAHIDPLDLIDVSQ
ncbi:MAG: peptidoglycan DD-metalloendopeptidase family protein [Epsilonproteobacteria bacterium]|nr:hypothetical protein [Campylobacterota bacterium]NPA57287.1 peptidoglycan DD-metalloendopeptidase family protein [Campylobacterota bacterium]